MQRCPNCRSRKFYGSKKLGWKCRNCGYENIPEHIRKSLKQKPNNDIGIIKQGIESYTIMNSSLFSEMHDLHNIAFKFKVLCFPESIDIPKQEGFRGSIYRFNHKGRRIMLSKNWLIIYNNRRIYVPLRDLAAQQDQIKAELIKVAEEIAGLYGIAIDPQPLLFSKNKPEIKTPFLSGSNFIEPEAKAVYPLPSPIELVGSRAAENAFNLSSALVQINDSLKLEIYNKQLHQKVLENMDQTLQQLRDYMIPESLNSDHKPEGFMKKIRSWFNEQFESIRKRSR